MLCRNVKQKLVDIRSGECMKPGAIFHKLEWGQGCIVKFLGGEGSFVSPAFSEKAEGKERKEKKKKKKKSGILDLPRTGRIRGTGRSS